MSLTDYYSQRDENDPIQNITCTYRSELTYHKVAMGI